MNDHLFDSLNPEHLKERLEALDAIAEKKPLEFIDIDHSVWTRWSRSDGGVINPIIRYRPAREPEYKPWSLANHPPGAVFVKWKSDSRAEYLIGNWDGNVCKLIGRGDVSYQGLLSDYICVDDSPCGVKEQMEDGVREGE